jgi:hypothetical protein
MNNEGCIMAENHDSFIEEMLATKKAEALEWLRASSPNSFRNLGEMDTTEESIEYVQRFYDAGAVTVLAVEIGEYDGVQNTAHLLVQLPADKPTRMRLFQMENDHAESEGFDGCNDDGQEYLYFKLD